MTNTRVDEVVQIVKEGDEWVVDGPNITIRLPAASRALANDIFQLARATYGRGRSWAFEDLRRLIGVDQ